MFCVNCGTQLPDDANFCLKCGKAQANGTHTNVNNSIRWDYKDILIPLNLSYGGGAWQPPAKVCSEPDRIILQSLQKEVSQGWSAAEPTDLMTLRHARKTVEINTWLTSTTKIISVSIRLKRMV
jgi:hypothetical protein